jgi:hypothetical protein
LPFPRCFLLTLLGLDLQSKPKACPNPLQFCPLSRRIANFILSGAKDQRERLSSYRTFSALQWFSD